MDKWKKYGFQPIKLELLIQSALVVVDTNVLLAAYQWKGTSFSEVFNTLKELSDKKRLVIPSQVMKEFSKNRPERIKDIVTKLNQISSNLKMPDSLESVVPALIDTPNFHEVIESRKNYVDGINNYRTGLKKLLEEVEQFYNYDPILEKLNDLFSSSYYRPKDIDEMKLIKEFESVRVPNKIPPGYKDGGKEENNAGDYIIWTHILSLTDDVIFLTYDIKPDWVIRGPNDRVLNARHELVEEFFDETNGKSFRIVTPDVFFKIYNPDLSDDTALDIASVDMHPVVDHSNQKNENESAKSNYFNLVFKRYFMSKFKKEIEQVLEKAVFSNRELFAEVNVEIEMIEREFDKYSADELKERLDLLQKYLEDNL